MKNDEPCNTHIPYIPTCRWRGRPRRWGAPELVGRDPHGGTFRQEGRARVAGARLHGVARGNPHHRRVVGLVPPRGRELWAIRVCRLHAQPPDGHAAPRAPRRHPRVRGARARPRGVLLVDGLEQDPGDGDRDHDGGPLLALHPRGVSGATVDAELDERWQGGSPNLRVYCKSGHVLLKICTGFLVVSILRTNLCRYNSNVPEVYRTYVNPQCLTWIIVILKYDGICFHVSWCWICIEIKW